MKQNLLSCFFSTMFIATLGYVHFVPQTAHAADESNPLTLLLAKRANLSEVQAETEVERIFSIIRTEVRAGNAVEIRNFGRFYVQMREIKPRVKKNKSNPATQTVPANEKASTPQSRRFLRFVSDKSVKEDLNGKKN